MTTGSADEPVAGLRAAFEPLADPEAAPAMARYMKNHFPFLGLSTAVRRAAQRPTLSALAAASGDELIAFADACWAQPEREFQYAAADALRRHHRALGARHLDALARCITTKGWWDTVDTLAAHAVGPLVARNPELVATMDRWVDGDELWLARTAILHQLQYADRTDADRLFAYAERRAGDTEFFIRKALGWALRQYARVDPEAVVAFVDAHHAELSGLTRREALKRIAGPPATGADEGA
ncbi:MAG: DNA alkylation repair protein [Acidimicrobiales bacterium]